MRIAIVGCGYVADFYLKTLANHPRLELIGVFDRDLARMQRFARYHKLASYGSLAELLADARVQIVVNLTNPGSHYEVSRAALEADKHVYSEKPLSVEYAQAEELVALAEQRGLELSSAPCSVLGETAQSLWKALRDGAVGTPRLAYAELDDGPIHLMNYRDWKSDSGNPWPYQDEFAVGCTLEHAGYYVTWLAAFFGPAKSVTSFSALTVPHKTPDVLEYAPDFSVACIEFGSGLVARVTSSIFGPHDHSLHIIGDDGILRIDECWDYGSPVYLQKRNKLGLKLEKHPRLARLVGLGPRRLPLVREPHFAFKTKGANRMDFARGVAELADAIAQEKANRLSARFSLHVNEIVLAIQHPKQMGSPRRLSSSFDPVPPADWASDPSRTTPARPRPARRATRAADARERAP